MGDDASVLRDSNNLRHLGLLYDEDEYPSYAMPMNLQRWTVIEVRHYKP